MAAPSNMRRPVPREFLASLRASASAALWPQSRHLLALQENCVGKPKRLQDDLASGLGSSIRSCLTRMAMNKGDRDSPQQFQALAAEQCLDEFIARERAQIFNTFSRPDKANG